MSTRLNKTTKQLIVNSAIESKFKKQYDEAFAAFKKAARDLAVSKSPLHEEFKKMAKKFDGALHHVKSSSSWALYYDIKSKIDFIYTTSHLRLGDPVYACNVTRNCLRDEDLPELVMLRELVKSVESEYDQLSSVVNSYSNVKKLVEDLPWVEAYLPESNKQGASLIAVDVINDINAKFGG